MVVYSTSVLFWQEGRREITREGEGSVTLRIGDLWGSQTPLWARINPISGVLVVSLYPIFKHSSAIISNNNYLFQAYGLILLSLVLGTGYTPSGVLLFRRIGEAGWIARPGSHYWRGVRSEKEAVIGSLDGRSKLTYCPRHRSSVAKGNYDLIYRLTYLNWSK